MASVEISFGEPIAVPSIPGIFQGGNFALVDATGSITVSANELILSGSVSLLGGLLGQGNATIDLNWTTGVYSVSGGFSIYDGIISFNGSLTITNQGDITLLAMASVNVPGVIPFIGGQSLGNLNFYLQYRPGEDWTQSFVSAWTNVNLFFTSFTFGFKIDFQGDVSLINGNDTANFATQAAMNTSQPDPTQPIQYVYSQDYTISDPGAASAQVTLSSLSFFDYSYADGEYSDTVTGTLGGAAGGNSYTNYQPSKPNVILPSLQFEVYNTSFGGNFDIGHVSFDAAGNFHFAPSGDSGYAPTGGSLSSFGNVTLVWPGSPPDSTKIITASYLTSSAIVKVLQQTSSGPVLVDEYAIDPTGSANGGSPTPTSPGGALYTDNLSDSNPVKAGGTWTSNYTLNHGDPDRTNLSISISSGNTLLGTGTFDSQGILHFVPHGTPSLVPMSGLLTDNTIHLDWGTNPGTITISAMYRSLNDRVLNIDFTHDVAPGGYPGQYTVEVVTPTPLNTPPTFTETTHYLPPTVSFAQGSPFVKSNGSLTGTIYADSFVPGAAQGGQGSPTDTKISLYYTQNDSTTGGTLFDTLDYGTFLDNAPGSPLVQKTGGFTWTGFQNLKAGQYYIYAVINDGQNPQVVSSLTGPYTTTGPYQRSPDRPSWP